MSRPLDIALTQFELLCTGAADLPALADICLLLMEAKVEGKATFSEIAKHATVELWPWLGLLQMPEPGTSQ